ncbi:MAG: tetratricopeptide repeat protein [Sneathiella sp.]
MAFRKLTIALFTLVAAHVLTAQIVYAAGSSSPTEAAVPDSPEFIAGKAAIDQQQWAVAIASFTKVTAADPKNADAYNYLGYANRKMKNYDEAFKNYNMALDINPEHRGANEYIGEAYLQTNNLDMAEKHLAKLDSICFFGCAEYTMLKRAVEEYKARS